MDRTELYESLESQIGNTPLVELPLELPRGNRIIVKEEFRNPTGSHYDRVFVHLIRKLEEQRKIIPGVTPLIETSSGSAGESFAWICNQLGYDATIVLPESAPAKKIEAMKEYGADLVLTPANEWVGGAQKELIRILTDVNKDRKIQGLPKFYTPNHSRDEGTLDAFENIGKEVMAVTDVDYFIAAIGNGTSLLAPARYMKAENSDLYVVGWEPLASASAFTMMYPGRLEKSFGISKGEFSHKLPGTGVPNVQFPFLEEAVKTVVDRVVLVKGEETELQLRARVDPNDYVGRGCCAMSSVHEYWANTRRLPSWEHGAKKFTRIDYEGGRTTAGGVEIAFRMISNTWLERTSKNLCGLNLPWLKETGLENKTFLVIGYDLMRKYEK